MATEIVQALPLNALTGSIEAHHRSRRHLRSLGHHQSTSSPGCNADNVPAIANAHSLHVPLAQFAAKRTGNERRGIHARPLDALQLAR